MLKKKNQKLITKMHFVGFYYVIDNKDVDGRSL
jgi:hypothetical protein